MIYCCQDWHFEEWLHENFQKHHYVDDICFQFWRFLRAHFPLTIWKKLSSKQAELLPVNQEVSTASAVPKIPKGMLNKEVFWDVRNVSHLKNSYQKIFIFKKVYKVYNYQHH